jgi:RNA polymerase sigma-70 factor (ECF subfamily)
MQSPDSNPNEGVPSAVGDNSFSQKEKWWDRLLTDGEAAPKAVIEDLHLFVHRVIQHNFGRRKDCDTAFIEDITQDATMRILKGLPNFRSDSRFTTWAASVAFNAGYSELRRARWKDVSLDELLQTGKGRSASQYEPAAAPADYDLDALRNRVFAALKEAMENDLTEKQRFAIEAALAKVPFLEVARHLNTNSNALYKMVHDARKKLKQVLLAKGIMSYCQKLWMTPNLKRRFSCHL